MRKFWWVCCVCGLLSAGMLKAAERDYRVLLIHSYAPSASWSSLQMEGLEKSLRQAGTAAVVQTECLDADNVALEVAHATMRDVCRRARQEETDAIVAIGDDAFHALFHCGDSLPYRLPVVVSGLKYPDRSFLHSLPNVCGYIDAAEFGHLLREASQVFPDRHEIVCLSDSSLLGQKGHLELERAFGRFAETHPEYTLTCLNVQAHTPLRLITSVCYENNAGNRLVVVPRWSPFMSFICKSSKAPVFSTQSLALTNGVFCAWDAEPSRAVAEVAALVGEVLRGCPPSELGLAEREGKLLYDYKQLRFFGVDEAKVEGHGTIMNVPMKERYRELFQLLSVAVFLLLILLIAWLVRKSRREMRRRIDVQAQLLAQQMLLKQRDEFDNFLNSVHNGLIYYDLDMRIRFVNNSLMRMLGFSAPVSYRQFEGDKAGSIFGIFVRGENLLHDLLRQVIETKNFVPIPENAFMNENARRFYFPVSGEVVPVFAKEKMTGVAIVCSNISEDEQRKRLFDLAISEGAVYPWHFDIGLNCFHFPDGLLDHFSAMPVSNHVTMENLSWLIHPDDAEKGREFFNSIQEKKNLNCRKTFRIRNVDGEYEWWEFRSAVYEGLNPSEPYMLLGICLNVQHYKDMELALVAARDKALQADKLKSAFLANMSHEIRTPLNAIVGFSDILQDVEAYEPEEVRSFVDIINKNCALLLALISDILDLSRIESSSMDFNIHPHSLTDILEEVYASQRVMMPEQVELCLDVPQDEELLLRTDAVRLKQVVSNLVNNARKFTAKGRITMGCRKEKDAVTLFVEDTGSGMSEESMKHIFERFYKEDSFTQGAGLGLSICQTIVERLGGNISVASRQGVGSRFEVWLPLDVKVE